MQAPLITKKNFFSYLGSQERPWQNNYLAMYSSQWHGITTDPDLMMLPVDDHLVHRGDGAFDVMRCVKGNIYLMEEHLQRLERSVKAISLEFPPEYTNIRGLVKDLVLMGGERDCLIRIVVSRGPGSFSANPYDCPSSQMYVNIIRFQGVPNKYYTDGISLVTSRIPIKKSFFANIKSCNYLPNVLMKMEAIKAGCPYSVALDEHGFLAEGSIENIGVLTSNEVLKFPETGRTLAGITQKRVFQLAGKLVSEKMIKDVKFAGITPEEAYQAKEIFLTGTSINLLPVVRYDGKQVGKGVPGPIFSKLSSFLWEDLTHNKMVLTATDLA